MPAANLEELLSAGRPVRLVNHTLAVFGDYFGQVTDPTVRKAVKHLHHQGKTSSPRERR